ncbi:MAG: Hsp33 family molecular chaperone HslO [Steroidobacteraceae bacterium]|uniref:Hsp33 family molecular chaperone HslO n=1 Tax=Paraburkholderia sp. TaxID=1926495 RepID=UPI003D7019DE
MIAAGDQVRRFIFEKRPVRGHWVRLENAWRALHAHTDYPQSVDELLGQAVAASVLLAATLKFRGTLTFQLQGNGAVKLLVAQCTHDFRLRAVARFDQAAVRGSPADARRGAVFRRLVGTDGRVTVTIEADEKSMRYQGVVPLAGTSLAESLEAYFASSEQLPTRVLLAADGARGAGMLVQKLPEAAAADEEEVTAAWQGAQRGIERLSAAELLTRPVEELLARGFTGHDLRLFRGAPVQFECRCSAGRVAGLLRALGPEEVRDVLREQGAVTVTCEFCHRPYRFDAVDVEALFAQEPATGGSPAIH